MREFVRFASNGVQVELRSPDPILTVLDWLRNERRLTGTKEGCAEGDCGACTVMLVDEQGRARAINACITFLPMIDGCSIVTVEGLESASPIQRAMVDLHGSQCGFCTPGIVMSLHAHQSRGGAATQEAINDCLAGNLCRCTGYGPIIRAGQEACAKPAVTLPAPPAQDSEPLGYTTQTSWGKRAFYAPTTLADLARLCEQNPHATILGGATDVGLWVTKQGRNLPTIISVMKVAELQSVTRTNDKLSIAAAVRYADAMDALVALHPSLRAYLRRLGATQVRDSGTVVGNIANGSPIGDMPPALIALGAEIVLRHGQRERRLPLENFFLDYGKQDRAPGEIVIHVEIPPPPAGAFFAAEKISKRFDQDISAVSAGFMVWVRQGAVAEARLAYGGLAGIPKRATHAEAALAGKPWTEATVRTATAALASDFTPLTDMRASAAYRLEIAANLLLRFFHETQGEPTRVTDLASLSHG